MCGLMPLIVAGSNFDITDYGAKAGEDPMLAKPNAAAIARAFAAAALDNYAAMLPGKSSDTNNSRATVVVVPAGTFMTGPVSFTADGQTLMLAERARLVAAWTAYGNLSFDHFSMTWPLGPKRPEGPESEWDLQYAPLVYAHNLTGVSLIGPGILDGAGQAWWDLKDKTKKGKFPKKMAQRPFVARFDGCRDVPHFFFVFIQKMCFFRVLLYNTTQ